jgi:uncharacterized protein (DUF58 family)
MRAAFRRWWEQKLPRLRWSAETTYIVPTFPGFCLLGGALAVFLLAAVYRNDTLYVHGFALLSLFFLGMLLTHANLRRIRVVGHLLADPFSGNDFALSVTLENTANTGCAAVGVRIVPGGRVSPRRSRFCRKSTQTPREVIQVSPTPSTSFGNKKEEAIASFEGVSGTTLVPYLEKKGTQVVRVHLRAKSRGRFPACAAFVMSRSPLGLFTAWRVSSLSLSAFVLPEPKGLLALPWRSGQDGEALSEDANGSQKERRSPAQQELDGLSPLRPGDTLSRVVWRRFAPRGLSDNRPLVRTLHSDARKHVVLTWSAASRHGAAGLEATLSQLTEWLLMCRSAGVSCDVETPHWRGHELTEAGCEAAMRALSVVAPEPETSRGGPP